MLETVWYMLILLVQVVQTNPQIKADKLQIEVFVASKAAYSFTLQGNFIQGQVVNAETRKPFGEFESTRRVPQDFVVFPGQALPKEMEDAALSAAKGKDGATSPAGKTAAAATAKTTNAKSDEAKPLIPFTIDYTKALKQLVSFRDKPHQSLEYSEKERFLAGDKANDKAATAKKAVTPPVATKSAAATPAAKTGDSAANPGTTNPNPSDAGNPDQEPATIELRYYPGRLVLTADFVQLVMIVYFP